MNLSNVHNCIQDLRNKHDIVMELDCNYITVEHARMDLYTKIKKHYQEAYNTNQRLIFLIKKDFYNKSALAGGILQTLQVVIQDIDISNFFVCLVTTNPDIDREYQHLMDSVSWDPVPFHIYKCLGEFHRIETDYKPTDGKFQSLKGITSIIDTLTDKQKNLLFVDQTFCIMPWVGISIKQQSQAYPCCEFDKNDPIGNVKSQSISEIWNSTRLKQIRQDMMNGKPVSSCRVCYHKEKLSRDSLRNSINRDFAHCIDALEATDDDGFLRSMDIKYWDVRYNNLCNFSCRSCNPNSSSSWYQIHNAIYPENKLKIPLVVAGQNSDSVFDQMSLHIDQVEKIYFVGGEPLIIEQFYELLEMLDERGRHDVHLLYNTNLSRLSLSNRSITDLWKKFKKVSIGASLDGMDSRAEYLRTGTDWNTIIENRQIISEQCPHVDFYVNATTGLINALHLIDFHKSWVSQGYLKVDDFNLHLLYEPEYLSLVNAPISLKNKIISAYTDYANWLQSRDTSGRALAGARSVISMCQESGTYDPEKFWKEIDLLDKYHNTDLLITFPELINTGLSRP